MYNEHMLFELHPTLCLHCEQNFDQKCKWSQYEYNESVPHQYLVLPLMITNTINYTESKKRERDKKKSNLIGPTTLVCIVKFLALFWHSWLQLADVTSSSRYNLTTILIQKYS